VHDFIESLRDLFDPANPAGLLVVFVFGTLIGSFLNVCIYRLPLNRSIALPGSACPHCGSPIPWWQNIPLLSYIALGARCFCCRRVIGFRYFLVELIAGAAITWLYAFFNGPSFLFFYSFVFTCFLIVIFFIDLDHWIILDNVVLPGALIGLAGSFLIPPGYSAALLPDFGLPHALARGANSLSGAIAGYFFFAVIAAVGTFFARQEALGRGDVKFAALLGAFLGVHGGIIAFLLAFFLGAFLVLPLLLSKRLRRRHPIPFGTFMALGGFISFLWGERLFYHYLTFQGILYGVGF
jgi:leader peptidase (prepilin peptidase)/N-methyltransferase